MKSRYQYHMKFRQQYPKYRSFDGFFLHHIMERFPDILQALRAFDSMCVGHYSEMTPDPQGTRMIFSNPEDVELIRLVWGLTPISGIDNHLMGWQS